MENILHFTANYYRIFIAITTVIPCYQQEGGCCRIRLPKKKGAFRMAKEGKSRKSLLIGVIAAVVILAGLLALVLTQCVGGQGDTTTPPTTTAATEPSDELALYWNVDRHNFEIVDDSLDTTGRKPADDGFYHVVFAKDGELIEFKVKERKIVRMIDGQDLMGLVFDADGVVIDIVRIEDMPVEKVAWQFYVQSIGGKTVKFNSAKEMTGMEVVAL